MTGTGSWQGGSGPLGAEAEERALSYAKDVLRQGMPRAAVEEVLRAQGFESCGRQRHRRARQQDEG